IASIFTGLAANDAVNALLVECPAEEGFVCNAGFELGPPQGNARTLAITTDVLLFGGLGVAATGLVLGLLFGLDQPAAGPQASLSCGPTGCVAQLGGSF
ncbi:MAG: hypothetical protein K8H88_18365, partial [Sandaracinaceae bacterium]|nr:hypothetical protein [Sandaracinaceae bacterium]